jgi:glycosyltransferase involved in cell wall biosynthesis
MDLRPKTLSVVVPCHDEEESIPLFYQETIRVYEESLRQRGLELEFIFVDDGSRDNTLQTIKHLREQDSRVHFISFSRNFGKEAAMHAGMDKACGDYIATMDADLQDPPHLLPQMLDVVTVENYDCAATKRINRKGEPRVRSWFAHIFYHLINRISSTEIVDGARDYRLMKRNVAEAVLSNKEYNRFSKGIFSWVGFKTKWIGYENIERSAGKTNWSFWKLFLYSIEGILAYSTAPLAIVSAIGIVFCILALVAICIVVIRALVVGDPVAGWPSMMSVVVFLGGMQLLAIGIVGLYISKIYLETKQRPLYIIKEVE